MEADFRRRINNALSKEEADDVRYERYLWECEQEERSAMTRDQWQETTDRLRANQNRGQEEEDAALNILNIQNNNYARSLDGQIRSPIVYESEAGVVTRPDGVTETKWIDVKSQGEGTVYYTDQLRAQKEGANVGHPDGKQRDLAVIISNSNRTDIQPSKPLADSAVIIHRDAQTGKWSFWDKRANKGQGGWQDITDSRTAAILGGTVAQ